MHQTIQFDVNAATGLIEGARQVPSPNWNERPAGMPIDLIVIHSISLPPGQFGGPWIDRLFTNNLERDAHPFFAEVADLKVSSHVLIRRDGEVVQYVPLHARAWHAGTSNYQGREKCNDYSIGIELEGDENTAYEPAQYVSLAVLIIAICRAYPTLSQQRIAGHEEIAPGRKTDPGPSFDWARLRAMLAARAETRA